MKMSLRLGEGVEGESSGGVGGVGEKFQQY